MVVERLRKPSGKPEGEVHLQTGREAWSPLRGTTSERFNEGNAEQLGKLYDEMAKRLAEAEITSEKEIRQWLQDRGTDNIGPIPVLDVAVERLLSRIAPESREYKKLSKKTEKIRNRFYKTISNPKDPERETRDKRLLGLYVEAQLGLAVAIDDLDRVKDPTGSDLIHANPNTRLSYDPKTHVAEVIDPADIEFSLYQYALRRHKDPHGQNWAIHLGKDHKELNSQESPQLVQAAIKAVCSDNPKALQEYWGDADAKILSRGKWNDQTREVVERHILDLLRAEKYLETVRSGLGVDTQTSKPRSAEERKKVRDDILASFPFGPSSIIQSEPNQRLGHAHRITKAKTKEGRTVKIQGGKTQSGETYFQGFGASRHQAAATAEELKLKEGVLYDLIPQRNAWASELFPDQVPVTVLGTKKEVVDGKQVDVNVFVQEWRPGLKRIDREEDCAGGELADAQAILYCLYDRDWGGPDENDPSNIGNIGVDSETRKICLFDPDFIGQPKLDSEPPDAPIFIRDDTHPLVRFPQYGKPFSEQGKEKFKSCTNEELLKQAERGKQLGLPEDQVMATINRIILVRELTKWTEENLGYACLPLILQPNGSAWDYINDPRFYNPGWSQFQYIIDLVTSQRRSSEVFPSAVAA